MKTFFSVRFFLVVAIALAGILGWRCCKPSHQPCCIKPNPVYTVNDGNLYVTPDIIAGVTGVRIQVTQADVPNPVFLLDTIVQTGQTVQLPWETPITVLLTYLSETVNVCPHEATFRQDGIIATMDVVIQNSGQGVWEGTTIDACTTLVNPTVHNLVSGGVNLKVNNASTPSMCRIFIPGSTPLKMLLTFENLGQNANNEPMIRMNLYHCDIEGPDRFSLISSDNYGGTIAYSNTGGRGFNLVYTYDPNGNKISLTLTAAQGATFTNVETSPSLQ